MRVWSLFTGVGGFDAGLEAAGHTVVLQCEADEWRRGILHHHWPEVHVARGVGGVRWLVERNRSPLPPHFTYSPDARVLAEDEGGRGEHRGNKPSYAPRPHGSGGRRPGPVHPDLICGGFPCQDLSVAGRRAGLNGARSGLFFEYARIVDAVRPGWVLIENVPGLLSSDGGRDFGIVLGTLADIGYGVAWRILDSQFFGVPQRRRRVFIVARLADGDPRAAGDRAGQVLAVGTRCRRDHQARGETGADVAVASLSGLGNGGPDDNDGQAGRLVTGPLLASKTSGWRGDDHEAASGFYVTHALTSEGHDASEDGTGRGTPLVADTLTSGSHPNSNRPGRRREDDTNLVAFHATQDPISGDGVPAMGHEPNGVMAGGVRRLTPRECERLQGFPDDWTLVPGVKCPDSRRYAAMGDAVTVPVARWLGERLAAA